MSLAIASNFSSSLAGLPNAAYVTPFALPDSHPKLSVEIAIPELDFRFKFPVSNISKVMPADSLNKYVFEVAIHDGANLILTLSGSMNDERAFRTEEVDINIDSQVQDAETTFVASSFYAAIGLGEKVRILMPELGLDLNQAFRATLSAVSEKLQWRQIAYRIMVIESATGLKFELPSALSGVEVEHLAFIYYAIVKRNFLFPFSTLTYPAIPATKQYLEQITNLSNKTNIVVGPDTLNRSFLGKTIHLGDDAEFVITDASIVNFSQVQKELARDDRHPVEVMIRSLSGRAQYHLPSAPRLPEAPWNPFLIELIDMDRSLDMRLAERYHDLAAGTLSGLSEVEIELATVRPDLPIITNTPL